jgi:hypothetical protein
VELAELQAKDWMPQKVLRDKDPKWTWNILKNRYPHEHKEGITTEVSGPDGGPTPGRHIRENGINKSIICIYC